MDNYSKIKRLIEEGKNVVLVNEKNQYMIFSNIISFQPLRGACPLSYWDNNIEEAKTWSKPFPVTQEGDSQKAEDKINELNINKIDILK